MAEPTAATATAATISIGLVFRCVWKAILYYNVIGMLLAAIVATRQEAKIWQNKNNNKKKSNSDLIPLNAMGYIKVFLFNLCWYIGCLTGSIYICVKHILTLGKSDIGYDANRCVEAAVANFVIYAFVGTVQVTGQEHLKSLFNTSTSTTTTNSNSSKKQRIIPAPIFVANHCSQLDIGAAYRIFDNNDDKMPPATVTMLRMLRFKWIAKHAVLYLPGVGPLMWLGDHILIYRRSPPPPSSSSVSSSSKTSDYNNSTSSSNSNSIHKASVAQLFAKSHEALQDGIAMFLFPQGTRRMTRGTSTSTSSTSTTTNADDKNDDDDDAHLPFKDGAFIMAEDNGSPLIPISIIIPRDNRCWNSWYSPLFHNMMGASTPTIRLVIHETVLATVDVAATKQKRSRLELKQLCYNAIYSVNFNSDDCSNNAFAETAKNK